MSFLSESVDAYLQTHASPVPELLSRLERDTHLKTLYPRMVSGTYQGRFLSMISQLLQPRRVLEIGTFTGYSCICLSEGLHPEGRITTIEMDAELGHLIFPYLEEAGISEKVDVRFGKALEVLADLQETWDLVFIDADKQNYRKYYERVFPQLRKGGIILADNVLWHGKVLDEKEQDKETAGIREFNTFVREDPRVEHLLLPIRDGIYWIRKI